jgi:quinol monooxygenase YgiN
MSDPRVVLVADVHGRAALVAELRALLDELARHSRAEPECSGFRILAAEQPGDFVMIGCWGGEAAMREHYRSAHYRRYREQVGPLLARPSDVVAHHVSATVHLGDPNPPDPGLLG